MGRLVRGTDLTDSLRREVLSRYVNRHHDTTSKTDSDWLAKKAFYVTKDGMGSVKETVDTDSITGITIANLRSWLIRTVSNCYIKITVG
jgi:hypothetical protein